MTPIEPWKWGIQSWDGLQMKGYRQITYAKDQPEYNPLPALVSSDGAVVTGWELTWRERLSVLFGGKLFLSLLTFNQPLQPVQIATSWEAVSK